MLPRKAAYELTTFVTVPKPTQVGGVNIPRRVRERWLRNSAKLHRNFGRRCALIREALYERSGRGLQRNDGCDCLPKTQDSANTQVDV